MQACDDDHYSCRFCPHCDATARVETDAREDIQSSHRSPSQSRWDSQLPTQVLTAWSGKPFAASPLPLLLPNRPPIPLPILPMLGVFRLFEEAVGPVAYKWCTRMFGLSHSNGDTPFRLRSASIANVSAWDAAQTSGVLHVPDLTPGASWKMLPVIESGRRRSSDSAPST